MDEVNKMRGEKRITNNTMRRKRGGNASTSEDQKT